jgi:hypothetical protein
MFHLSGNTHCKPRKNGVELKVWLVLLNPFPRLSLAFDLACSIDGHSGSTFRCLFEALVPCVYMDFVSLGLTLLPYTCSVMHILGLSYQHLT